MSCEIYRIPVCVPEAWQKGVATASDGGENQYIFGCDGEHLPLHKSAHVSTFRGVLNMVAGGCIMGGGCCGTLADQLSVRLMLIPFYN